MPPPNSQDSSHPTTPPHSIPLQNLGPPPESVDLADGHRQHTRGRSILGGITSRPTSGGYERVENGSPSRTDRPSRPPVSTQSSRAQQNRNYNDEPETPSSPVDTSSFAAAMAFTGLSVPDISISQVPQPSPAPSTFSPFGTYGTDDIDRISPYGDASDEYFGNQTSYFPSEGSDSIPLTDASHLQPISGAQVYSSGGQRHNRSESFHSVNFDSADQVRRRSSRHADGLGSAEQGRSPRVGRSRGHSYGASLAPDAQNQSRSRSPSTTSGAFLRAGSIVRAMSQRVVNISGEAEMIDFAARRASRLTRQPSLSTMASLSDEEEIRFQPKRKKDPLAAGPNPQAQLPTAPVEKAMKFFGKGEPVKSYEEEIEKPPNPLQGRSLGIFSSDSKVRNWLCDVLVYPLTEPVILILIMVQTILLAVESSKSVYKNPRPKKWGGNPTDFAIFGLFVIFTLEIIARIIVSGFILNAPEYSSTKGKVGAKAIILDKYRAVFKPQRGLSTKGNRPSPALSAPTVLRSFTAIQGDKVRTVEQAQRLQLARRAFLRHGFNRLDFVAVCAFWVAFVLGVTGIEASEHLYVFRMLSCLRILRLLALTHGTAVCIICHSNN